MLSRKTAVCFSRRTNKVFVADIAVSSCDRTEANYSLHHAFLRCLSYFALERLITPPTDKFRKKGYQLRRIRLARSMEGAD